jgi:tetratricopeptide (TPR) repeat protein
MYKFNALKDRLATRLELIAQGIRSRPRVATFTAVGIVLAVMVYGTYVSVFLPRQRMANIQEAYAAADFQRVIDIATKVVDNDPRNIQAALALAAALLQQAQIDGTLTTVLPRVREILLVAERFAPDNSEVQRQLGYVALLAGDYDLAEGYLVKATELNPTSASAYAYLCVYYDVVRKKASAVEACRRSIELDPYDPFALVASANVMITAKDLRQARLYAESAIIYAKDPVILSEAYSVAAFIAVEGFDLKTARENVEKSLAANPKNFDSLVLFSEIAMRSMAYDTLSGKKAQESADWVPMLKRAGEAMRVDSSNYYPYLLFMRAYEISGDTASASKHREIARRLVLADTKLSEIEKQDVVFRLDAAQNIRVTGVKLLPEGAKVSEDAIRAYVIQP